MSTIPKTRASRHIPFNFLSIMVRSLIHPSIYLERYGLTHLYHHNSSHLAEMIDLVETNHCYITSLH